MPAAARIAEQAIAQGVEHPRFLVLAAYRRLNAGEPEGALAFATRAHKLAPGNIDVLNAMGECLARSGRPHNAVAFFERALIQAPDSVVLQGNAAAAYEQISELKRACEGYARVVALDPQRADAAARLAFLSAVRGDMARAREMGERALALDPAQSFASFAVALADIDAGQHRAAHDRLVDVIDRAPAASAVQAMAQSILGDALHEMGRPAEAFAAYAAYGTTMHALHAPEAGSETALARVRRIAAFVAHAPAQGWRSSGEPAPYKTHVFVVGFPRSGTTLLAQVLAAHPAIAVLDEKQTLLDSQTLVESDAGLERLAAMGEEELFPLRRAYWKRVSENGAPAGGDVFVDKRPLDCEVLCLIAKLFPEARIVFALRDPRDVVLSAFRRRFGMTRQMYELLTLQGAARYYDAVLDLSMLYRERLALPVLDVRHEAFVRDFEAGVRALCAFLGTDYDPSVADFASRAGLGNVATPSAAQLVRGLDGSGVGRWRAYREQLAPVLPLLSPWVERFGYRES